MRTKARTILSAGLVAAALAGGRLPEPTVALAGALPGARLATLPARLSPEASGAAGAPATQPCPANLADHLASTRDAGQLVTVEAREAASTVATVEAWRLVNRCWRSAGGPWPGVIGRNGFSDHHREGDGTTPTGIYGIGAVMYGTAPNPGTAYPYHRLVCGDWWDEDPTSADYNTFQHVPCGQAPPFGGSSEALWTETNAYPSFAVIEYNTRPVVPYAGSAIFLHADIGEATTGCVSLPLADLDRALDWLVPGQRPVIVMGPAAEIRRF
jgi:L,D-peptidoglycan transpeptidase YkuD (ErfK/YbiS/YcfS/YnhG family)